MLFTINLIRLDLSEDPAGTGYFFSNEDPVGYRISLITTQAIIFPLQH